ncbi:CCA tRNA nucleotidyltransferase [Psychroserpens sp. NJDZ02]|uniref:CCA tRNA nucleotidyltransferase n=1 Tax=Psychroserpens sp. NJDZ02 TaxID=2570561 RepID=UPI0010A8D86E|nr:HD domain-containing protein [Psychroserpens sp. NJDZ02]QCE41262.1 HD domain-containing protein [Psychroserpens sp. NJDZ02]
MENRILKMQSEVFKDKIFQSLLQTIEAQKGVAMLIGGAVIDSIQGSPLKDIDIEVYGLSYTQLVFLVKDLDLPCNLVGKSFGVIKTTIHNIEIDISVPRRENKIGIGHKGFEIELDEKMTPKQAGKRRDLTINSMYQNLHNGQIIDPYNGLKDLKAGIIQATDKDTFIEDPLRVLRIMQLLPRKGKQVAKETMALCQSMINTFTELPKERVFVEWEKLLLKANKPSVGLAFLKDSGWLIHFPELKNLINCPQNPVWHPEGDVWIHTNMVLDNAAKLRPLIPEDWKLAYMFGALLHDVGKPSTTTSDLKAYGHDTAGINISEQFLKRMTDDKKLIEKVTTIVGLHMRPAQLFSSKAKEPAWKRLHNKCRLDILGWQSKADSAGRTGKDVILDAHDASEKCFELFDKFGETRIQPLVLGRDLITLGIQPSEKFKTILEACYEKQLNGYNKEDIIKSIRSN